MLRLLGSLRGSFFSTRWRTRNFAARLRSLF
jgi:hypothetical protein